MRIAYYFGRPNEDPERAADFFVDVVNPSLTTDLLCLDLESRDGRSLSQVNAWARAWAARVRRLVRSHPPGLYAGASYIGSEAGVGLNKSFGWWWYPWWYPRYSSAYEGRAAWPSSFSPTLPSPNTWGRKPDFWQFSQSFPLSSRSR